MAKAAYGWGVKRGALSVNPFVNLPVAPTPRRERVLSDDELAAIWCATDDAGAFNGIVRLLILTGQWREEVAGMKWAEVSADFSTWVIPASRAKNGATHIVPLSAPAQDLLRTAPRFGELVFPGLRGSAAGSLLSGATKALEGAIRSYFSTEEGRGRACQVDYVRREALHHFFAYPKTSGPRRSPGPHMASIRIAFGRPSKWFSSSTAQPAASISIAKATPKQSNGSGPSLPKPCSTSETCRK